MTIAPHKWTKRCAQQSTWQRAQAKARLLGTPYPPTRTAVLNRLPPPPTLHNPAVRLYEPVWHYEDRNTGQTLLTMPSVYQTPITLTYTFTYGGNYMPISQMTQGVWNQWANNMTVTNTGSYTNQVWDAWNTPTQFTVPPPPTPEEIAAAAARVEEQNRLYRESEARRAGATHRALKLFIECLSPEQRECYHKNQWINVRGSRGGQYRIRCNGGQSGNVDMFTPDGRIAAHMCIHPRGVPHADAWLAQKLELEHDEDNFNRIANISYVGGGFRQGQPLAFAA